jgi:hypothetical protein
MMWMEVVPLKSCDSRGRRRQTPPFLWLQERTRKKYINDGGGTSAPIPSLLFLSSPAKVPPFFLYAYSLGCFFTSADRTANMSVRCVHL